MPDRAPEDNELLLVFGARALLKNAPIRDALRTHFEGTPIIGCSTSGEIAGDEVADDSVVATLVHLDHSHLRVATTEAAGAASSYAAGETLARQLAAPDLRHIFVLSDGLNINGSDLARGLESAVSGDISITGGLSGDGSDFAETCVVDDRSTGDHRVAAVGLYGDGLRIGYASKGGWEPFGPKRTVTRAEGNVLYELDGRSALDLYKTYLGDHAKELPGAALLFPIVVSSGDDGEGVVRTVLSVDEQAKTMTFAGDIPQGATAQLMKTNVDHLVDGASGAAELSIAGFGETRPELAILVSCVGRKLVMRQRVEEEIEAVREVLGADAVIAGFYSYGELSPFERGKECRLHNQTMTITTFAEV